MAKVQPEEGVAQTVIENDLPDEVKSVSLTSPWGSKVTVPADQADALKDGGFTAAASSSKK
jgi:hypothetical protein